MTQNSYGRSGLLFELPGLSRMDQITMTMDEFHKTAIQIVSVLCSLIAQWAPAAVTPAPAAAGFGATPEA